MSQNIFVNHEVTKTLRKIFENKTLCVLVILKYLKFYDMPDRFEELLLIFELFETIYI